MRLTELRPRPVCDAEGRKGMGLSFNCPSCRTQRLSIWYANPMDGGPARQLLPIMPDLPEDIKRLYTSYNNRWLRTGEDFETLSLSPSVDATSAGHWHGFITNGNVTEAPAPCTLKT